MIFCARLPSFSIMFLRFMFISILHCFLWLNNVQLYECVCALSCVQLFAAPWIVACQAPLSTGFSRQEYWSRVPFPSPRNLSNPGIKPGSPALQADSLPAEPPGKLKQCIRVLISPYPHQHFFPVFIILILVESHCGFNLLCRKD